MSVRSKLLSIVLLVALLPLGFLAFTIIGLHQEALHQKISELHARSAKYGAGLVEAKVEGAVQSLKPTIETSINWEALSHEEQLGALWLLQGQLSSIALVALLDSTGYVLATTAGNRSGELPREQQLLAAALEVSDGAEHGFVRGRPVHPAGTERLFLPVGFRVTTATGPAVLIMGIDLAQPCAALMHDRSENTLVMLNEANQRTLCAFPPRQLDVPIEPELAEQLRRSGTKSLRWKSRDGTEMLAAAATTPWGFRVVVAQPLREAFAASRRMRLESLIWLAVGALSAVGAGLVLARAITQPLRKLARGAELVAQGEFGVRLEAGGKDELSAVAASFNRMCGEIEARELSVRGWNEELRRRVEQKTGELKDAQDALLESRKLAAVSALAAGVAHEINNPLTGIIGLTQVLLMRARKRGDDAAEGDMLESVEREALRVRDIVSKLLLLSEAREASGHAELQPMDWVRAALNARHMQLMAAGLEVEEQLEPNLPCVLGNQAELVQVLCELIDNAVKALYGRRGKLTISLDTLDAELVRLRVIDTGRGISEQHLDQVFEPFFTTKDDWHGQGLGLTVAYRIVEAHHGSIKLESRLGEGTTVTLLLPTKRAGAHLV